MPRVDLEHGPAVEADLARQTVARGVYVGPVLVLVFGLLRGWDGAWSAAIGVVLVVANFLISGAILSISVRISLQAYHAAALIGFFLRLGLFVGAVYLIASAFEVDRLAFGVSAVVAYFALLTWEAITMSRGREREPSWRS
ncbi:MAG TPA: ATP synthase subunit I [Acidimicrobiia bacterium]|nr:ATP synthase subunit I [Acidimicrobiia bacterium]